MATSEKSSPAERLLEAVGGAQSLALSMTRQATSYTADRLRPVPGFPPDLLDGPSQVVDSVFEQIEDALAERSPRIRDVVHQQGTFVKGVFDSIRPIVDALAADTSPTDVPAEGAAAAPPTPDTTWAEPTGAEAADGDSDSGDGVGDAGDGAGEDTTTT